MAEEGMLDNKYDMKMEGIVKLSRRYSVGIVPNEFKQTLPVITRDNSTTTVSIFYTPMKARFNKESQKIEAAVLFPAVYQIEVHYPSGKFKQLRNIKNSIIPKSIQPDGSLGVNELGSISVEEYLQLRKELYSLYDELIILYGVDNGLVDNQQKKRFREIFTRIHEKPYIYYYKNYGKDFFNWIWNR